MNTKYFLRGVLSILSLVVAVPASAQCTGELTGNGIVDGADLGTILAYWGPRTQDPVSIASDLNGDGLINGADLGILLANWGKCPIPTWGTVIEAQPDPAVVTDSAQRTAIQATGLPWRVRDNGTGIEMLLVPPGIFQMGCIMGSNFSGCYSAEQPVHQVTLTNGFYLGRYEVTQAQWVTKMGSNPSSFQGYADSPGRPVEQVSWNTVQGYLTTTGMRLPTEAEWEYACRAGTQTPFYNGSTDESTVGTLAWYGSCCGDTAGGQTHAVGGKAGNAFGFHDMSGNVWEWVNDWYGDYPSTPQTNPVGPAIASYRVVRGGAWFNFTLYAPIAVLSSSFRWPWYTPPERADSSIGFRVARNP